MEFVTTDWKEPIIGESYRVKCTGFCESGFFVAEYEGPDPNKPQGSWCTEISESVISDYIESYYPVPLNDVEISIHDSVTNNTKCT